METIVVKIGGSTLGNHDTTLSDLVDLQKKGFSLVVIHGGGNKITEWLTGLQIKTKFVKGLRVTDKPTLDVVIAVLCGLINKELVSNINKLGGKALGLSGADGNLLQAVIKQKELGYVGEIVKVEISPVKAIIDAGYIPVISPCAYNTGNGDQVKLLNINGDTAACEIAVSLNADRLIFLTDVDGVRDNNGKIISHLNTETANKLILDHVIVGGMIPKVEACIRAVRSIKTARIIDGRKEHALINSIGNKTQGTVISND
ncbi:MAG: acetylglutamate kinase [Chloroflexi bacterium]|nr:acetylglutamate kinase [Chloroflexota bacterium]